MYDMKQITILYVEDDDETREALTRFLKRRAGKVFAAASGEEGIEQFRESRPDIIIADLLMPGISGLEMIERIREEDTDCHVMITSTINEVNTIISAVDLGIDHYIIKPIDTDDLEQKLLHMAETIRKRRKQESSNQGWSTEIMGNKGTIEDEIRKEFIRLLKSASGKGARDVTVYLHDTSIDITAYNAMTVMEATVLNNPKNVGLIEQNRKLFYGEIAREIEKMAGQITDKELRLITVEINGLKGIDKLRLTIV